MSDIVLFKRFINAGMFYGFCPLKYYKHYCYTCLTTFICLFLVTFTGLTLTAEYYRWLQLRNSNTIEYVFSISDALTLSGIYLSICNSHIRNRSIWNRFLNDLTEFEAANFKVNRTSMPNSKYSSEHLRRFDHQNNVIRQKSNNRKRYILNTLKLASVHLFIPLMVIVDIRLFIGKDITLYEYLFIFPAYLGWQYEFFISLFLREATNVFVVRYKYVQDRILTLLKDEEKYLYDEFKTEVQHIKRLYKILYQLIVGLNVLFGSTILFIFVNIVIRFLWICSTNYQLPGSDEMIISIEMGTFSALCIVSIIVTMFLVRIFWSFCA